VWSTPVPYYLANQGPLPESGLTGTLRGSQEGQGQGQQSQQSDPQQQQVGVAGDPWDVLGVSDNGGMRASVRRHSLGSIPTAAKVVEKQVRMVHIMVPFHRPMIEQHIHHEP